MSDIRIQFTITGQDAELFTDLLLQQSSELRQTIPASTLARKVVSKWLDHQRRKATYGTGINPAENSGV